MPVPHHSSFLQAGRPSYHPTNNVKALKAFTSTHTHTITTTTATATTTAATATS